ncbi:MAG: class III poly(R)-hydroxyalkanoic acid synthase subunit PhaC [Pirellulales bacterium]
MKSEPSTAMLDAMLSFQRSVMDESFKAWNRVLAAPAVAEKSFQVHVSTTPHDVVMEKDELRLLHYRPIKKQAYLEPVLITYALVNRPYILDLQPDRSVVRQFLEKGFDVYLIDWGVPTAADRTMRLADYVAGSMRHIIEVVRRLNGVPHVNLLGYCMGGTMSTIFTTLYPDLVRNLMLMAAPIDFSGDECLLHLWTREDVFDVDRLIDAYGNCPATLLQSSFQLMKPVQNFVEKYITFSENMADPKFLENYFAMEKWTNDNIPVAGETFREFVKCFYQRNQLVKGEYKLDGKTVQLSRIECPLLLLTADFDHLVLPQSTLGIRPHVGSKDVTHLNIAAGHVGLAVGSKAHRDFWPKVSQWAADRSTPLNPTEPVATSTAQGV